MKKVFKLLLAMSIGFGVIVAAAGQAHAASGLISINVQSRACSYYAGSQNGTKNTYAGFNINKPCDNHQVKVRFRDQYGSVHTTKWIRSNVHASFNTPVGASRVSAETGGLLVVSGTHVWVNQNL